MCAHSCEDEHKAGENMHLEFGVEDRAGDVDWGAFRELRVVRFYEWVRYRRLTKDLYTVNNYPNISPLAFSLSHKR